MSEMKTNSSSEDTLIRDSQINGFFAFKERIGFCCSRIFKRSSKYDLSSISKKDEEQQDKPSYINQALQEEKQLRKDKLEKIARTLPGVTSTHTQAMRGPTSVTQTPTRLLTTITQETPRSGITLAQPRPPISTSVSKTGISTISKPSPLVTNTKTNKNDSDETTDSSKQESSDDDDRSSDSGSAPAKRAPTNRANNRR